VANIFGAEFLCRGEEKGLVKGDINKREEAEKIIIIKLPVGLMSSQCITLTDAFHCRVVEIVEVNDQV
jgi:hypothetical protein